MWLIKNVIGANCRKQPQKQGFMNRREEGGGPRCFDQSASGYARAREGEAERDPLRRTACGARDEEAEIIKKKLEEGGGGGASDFRRKRRSKGEKRVERGSQFEGLVPGGVEAALDGLGLLFALVARVRDQLQLHVGV